MHKTVDINFDLLAHQEEFLSAKSGEVALVGGFRAGKTRAGLVKSLVSHLTKLDRTGKSKGMIAGANYSLTMDTIFYPLCDMLADCGIDYEARIVDKSIETQFGKIYFGTLTKPQMIIAREFTWAWFDEFDLGGWKNCKIAYDKIISRLSGCPDPILFFTTTYEGLLYTYELFERSNSDGKRKLIIAKTEDNPFVPQEYIDMLKSNYDARLVEMYLHGKAINLNAGQVFYNFDRARHIKEIDTKRLTKIYVGMDFNVNPMSAEVAHFDGKNVYFIDEISLQNANTELMAKSILSKYGWLGAQNIVVFPDASGGARRTSAPIGDTDLAILRGFGFDVRADSRNPDLVDSYNAMNRYLQNSIGETVLYVSAKCPQLIDDFEQLSYRECSREVDKSNPNRSHYSDAARYLANGLLGIYEHGQIRQMNENNIAVRSNYNANISRNIVAGY